MPSLVLDEPRGSALGSAACAAIHEQIEYARTRNVPWGISESAYAASDHTLAYQYAPQGVPRLALRRTPLDELVIAPYATALAAMFNPHAATANLRRLERIGARGEMGFVEALDFTPERQTGDGTHTVVDTFMAHHQGMTIVALCNALHDGAVRRWGMSDPRISAVASLLQERIPREVSRLLEPPPGPAHADARHRMPSPVEVVPGARAATDASAVERSLQRLAARQRRRMEPVRPRRCLALARRRAARRIRHVLLLCGATTPARRSPSPSIRRRTTPRRIARRFTPTGCISTRSGPICARIARCGSAPRTTSNCAGSNCGASRRSRFASN